MAAIKIIDDAHWHSLRAKHIGGTESSCVCGVESYTTMFELYHRKKGNIGEPDFSDNQRVFWGSILEPAIATGAAKTYGWQVEKVTEYYTNDNCPGHGATLDYRIINHPIRTTPGIMEIKTVDWLTYKEWEDGEPPLNYMLQFQTQCACSGYSWGVIAVLIGGNDLKIFEFEARPKTIALIERAVTDFWTMVNNNTPPAPDFQADAAVISELYRSAGGGWTNLTGNLRAMAACDEYTRQAAIATEAEKKRKAARAELLTLMGNADTGACGNYKISAKMVTGSAVSYTKADYRNIRVTGGVK